MSLTIEHPSGTSRRVSTQSQAGETSAGPSTGLAQLLDLPELPLQAPALGAKLVDDRMHPLHHVKASLQVCVGSAEISVGELLDARENHVVVLDRSVEHPVDVLVEGRVVARGYLIAVDDQFAVRITELPLPLAR